MQIYTKKLCQRYVAQIQKTLAKCCNVLYEGVKKKLLSGVLNSFYYLSRVGMYTHLCRWQVVYTKPADKE